MAKVDKRRRNARPSKYKPRSPAQLARKRELWAARSGDRERAKQTDEEAALIERLAELETALREAGQDGIHKQRHVTPLEDIVDDAKRFHVLKARVERLEALSSINKRRRETRGKIIIGGALLAEAGDAHFEGDDELLARLVDILDRRVERVRDRLTVRELLGDVPLPLRPGGDLDEDAQSALQATGESLPDFDAMAESALAQEDGDGLLPSEVDPDYADLDQAWRAA
jgi:hypothetical protein